MDTTCSDLSLLFSKQTLSLLFKCISINCERFDMWSISLCVLSKSDIHITDALCPAILSEWK